MENENKKVIVIVYLLCRTSTKWR